MPGLDESELATLGGDVVLGSPDGGAPDERIVEVRAADVTVGDGMERDVAHRVVRRIFPGLKGCFETAAEMNAQLGAAHPALKMTIDTEGNVATAAASPPTGDAELDACLAKMALSLTFPAPLRPVEVRYGLSVRITRVAKVLSPFEMVLTRLHARYDKSSLGEDIVFKAVDAIAGGREHMLAFDAGIERGSTPSPSNNFQARYVIRHPWTGPIACEKPFRGSWGGPPLDAGLSAPSPIAATGLAFVPRGQASLTSFVKEVPEIGFGSASAPPAPSEPPPAPSAAPAPEAKKSCAGCATAPNGGAWGGMAAGLLGGALLVGRRARRRGLARPRPRV